MLGTEPVPDVGDGGPAALFDPPGVFASMFPALAWPATFLLEPEGRLATVAEHDPDAKPDTRDALDGVLDRDVIPPGGTALGEHVRHPDDQHIILDLEDR